MGVEKIYAVMESRHRRSHSLWEIPSDLFYSSPTESLSSRQRVLTQSMVSEDSEIVIYLVDFSDLREISRYNTLELTNAHQPARRQTPVFLMNSRDAHPRVRHLSCLGFIETIWPVTRGGTPPPYVTISKFQLPTKSAHLDKERLMDTAASAILARDSSMLSLPPGSEISTDTLVEEEEASLMSISEVYRDYTVPDYTRPAVDEPVSRLTPPPAPAPSIPAQPRPATPELVPVSSLPTLEEAPWPQRREPGSIFSWHQPQPSPAAPLPAGSSELDDSQSLADLNRQLREIQRQRDLLLAQMSHVPSAGPAPSRTSPESKRSPASTKPKKASCGKQKRKNSRQ